MLPEVDLFFVRRHFSSLVYISLAIGFLFALSSDVVWAKLFGSLRRDMWGLRKSTGLF